MKLGKAFPLLVAIAASAPVAAIVVACSDSTDPDAPDAGTDGATDGTTTTDAKADAKLDGGTTTKEGGNCSAVKGDCDIVLQDCPNDSKGNKQECIVQGSASALSTKCVPVQSSQTLPIGKACCPNGGGNPCLPGLTCVGDDCADGGPPTGRCTPACCEGDDPSCGQSDPEGIAGACDISLFIAEKEVHRVCSYRERCKPFKQEPCDTNKVCIIEDKVGTAGCISSNNKPLGAPCSFGNDCADGLFCLNLQGADGGVCRMECLTPGSNHPFDASVEQGGPLRGGCNPGELCNIGPFQDLPSWLSFCRIDGG